MSLTDVGAEAIASAIIGDGDVTLFNAANAAIGVGDDDTAFAADQTELEAEASSAPGSSLRKAMDSGYPLRDPDDDGSDNKIRFKATFGTAEGNFHWEEWGIFNDDTEGAGEMLCRVVEDLGTKPGTDSWIFTIDVTVSA